MSIQQNPTQWGAQLPPSPNDPTYWHYRHRREMCRRNYAPVNRPNPELEANQAAYWRNLFPLSEETNQWPSQNHNR